MILQSSESLIIRQIDFKENDKIITFLTRDKCFAPQGFIYLRVHPEIAFERIQKRNRLAEKKLTLAYLRQIHEKHEAFLMKKHALCPSLNNVPILTLDVNQEFESDTDQFLCYNDIKHSGGYCYGFPRLFYSHYPRSKSYVTCRFFYSNHAYGSSYGVLTKCSYNIHSVDRA